MPRERKFYFLPMTSSFGKRREQKNRDPWVAISKNGNMRFGKPAIDKYQLQKDTVVSIRFFIDIPRRSLGWYITKHIGKKEDGYRLLKVSPYKNQTGAEFIRVGISINSFLQQLSNTSLPSERLKINSYKDTDLGVELDYITIPNGKAKDKSEESQEV